MVSHKRFVSNVNEKVVFNMALGNVNVYDDVISIINNVLYSTE